MAKKNVKKAFKKLKYLDKTQATYFVVTIFIAAFCLFTGVTYSYFLLSEKLGSATITIAKINYTLSSSTSGYNNGSITVPAGEKVFLDLDLKSHNPMKTKYALNYTASNGVNVYYSENLKKNVEGIIGSSGSVINIRLVIENTTTVDQTVTLTVNGGYLQNAVSSNITTGYFEQDETIRYVLYDEDFENATIKYTMPNKNEYSYYKSECSNGATPNFDETNWTFTASSTPTSCDVYFKKATEGLEKYYNIESTNGLITRTKVKPDTSGLYTYENSTCSNGATYTFDEATFNFNVTNYTANTLCVANFKTDASLEESDKIVVTFDSNGGKNSYSKILRVGGTYGDLPTAKNGTYALDGWYTAPSGGTKIESSTPVTNDSPRTLYAHWKDSVVTKIIASAKTGTPDFSQISPPTSGADDSGVYSMDDEDGTSYYFRGNVSNNYVKFGKLSKTIYIGSTPSGTSQEFNSLAECQDSYFTTCTQTKIFDKDIYWRIIRINGNGTIRMIYDGTEAHANGQSSTDRLALTSVAYNTSYDDAKYVGYMYGGALGTESTSKEQAQKNETPSNIKTVLEKWYEDNILGTKYENYISDEIFCNDRSLYGPGYGASKTTYYGPYNRANDTYIATFRCDTNDTIDTKNDKFTVGTKGNEMLKYPIGLITADEIMTAGGEFGLTNYNYFLYKGDRYLSFSPYGYDYDATYIFGISSDGSMNGINIAQGVAVAPVINLNAEISINLKGTGTATDPYTIE